MLDEMFERIDEYHNKREQEFEKLAIDPPARTAEVGDRVLVSAGVLGMGFEWERLEATVIEVADTAYHIRFKDKKEYGTYYSKEVWAHRFAITDVLGKEPK